MNLSKLLWDENIPFSTLASNNMLIPCSRSPRLLIGSFTSSRLEENDFQSNAPSVSYSGYSTVGLEQTSFSDHAKEHSVASRALRERDTNAFDDDYTHRLDDFNLFSDTILSSSWSNPSFGDNVEGSAANQSRTRSGELDFSSLRTGQPEGAVCLDYVAGFSGLDPKMLARQVSTTADKALQHLAQEDPLLSGQPSSSTLSLDGSPFHVEENEEDHCWPLLPPSRDPDTGSDETSSCSGTASSDLTGDTSYETDRSSDSSSSNSPSSIASESSDMLSVPVPAETQRPITRGFLCGLTPTFSKDESSPPLQLPIGATLREKMDADYILSDADNSSSDDDPSPFPSPTSKKRKRKTHSTKGLPIQKVRKQVISEPMVPMPPGPPVPAVGTQAGRFNGDEPVLDFGTPILDAHKGITLQSLKDKASRFLQRNPGVNLDNRWLASFAGKLTAEGLLLDQYRCYINGCLQTNKRRDHILIHISGAHLNERPYQCSYCSTRFLRKNECKRHEFSHAGTKPFLCDICPDGTVSYVRQDLLRRHKQRKHGKASISMK